MHDSVSFHYFYVIMIGGLTTIYLIFSIACKNVIIKSLLLEYKEIFKKKISFPATCTPIT